MKKRNVVPLTFCLAQLAYASLFLMARRFQIRLVGLNVNGVVLNADS